MLTPSRGSIAAMATTPCRTGIVCAIAIALFLAACGDSDDKSARSSPAGNGVDRAFATEMIAHHQMAIEMAKMAQTEAGHAEIKQLAGDIIEAQRSEITKLRSIVSELAAAGVEPGDLGVPEEDRGMDMKMSDLEGADPFDRHFIDMMVPHHEGAIAMARAEMSKGENSALRELAEAIISAQQAEVNKMRDWRKMWYGASGGSPDMADHDM